MTCAHCENSVREEVGQLAGVDRIEVSVGSGRLVVTSSAPISDSAVVAAVDEAGYEAVPV
jgi:copper chaperone CopZ